MYFILKELSLFAAFAYLAAQLICIKFNQNSRTTYTTD